MPKRSPADDVLPFPHETDDPARDQTGDLHHADAAGAGRNDQAVALIVEARLVEVGIKEFAGLIDDLLNAPRRRAAVDVTIEHAHEDRDARQQLVAEGRVRAAAQPR